MVAGLLIFAIAPLAATGGPVFAAAASAIGGAVFAATWKSWSSGSARQSRNTELRSILRLPLPLPTVAEAALLFGLADPFGREVWAQGLRSEGYVLRGSYKLLDEALATRPFVLVVDEAGMGRSAAALASAVRVFPDHKLIAIREGPGSLSKFLALLPGLELGPEPALVWLDDLAGHVYARSVDVSDLLEIMRRTPRLQVLSTVRPTDLARLIEGDKAFSRLVMELATVVSLDAPGRQEIERIEKGTARSDNESTRGLRSRYEEGLASSPAGMAVLRAAIDWKRVGAPRPIRESELHGLFAGYIASEDLARSAGEGDFQQGLAWATGGAQPFVKLVRDSRWDEPAYEVEDEVLQFAESTEVSRAIPSMTWELAIDRLDPAEVLSVGSRAVADHVDLARSAFVKAELTESPEVALVARAGLALLLELAGDFESALRRYNQILHGANPDLAAFAAIRLGTIYARRGETVHAIAAYQEAMRLGEADRASAALNLAELLVSMGRMDAAIDALRTAIASGNPEQAADGAARLGDVLRLAGHREKATAAYQRALESGFPSPASRAALAMGELLEEAGDASGAKAAYMTVEILGHPDYAAKAALKLGLFLQSRSEFDEAEQALDRSLKSSSRWQPIGVDQLSDSRTHVD